MRFLQPTRLFSSISAAATAFEGSAGNRPSLNKLGSGSSSSSSRSGSNMLSTTCRTKPTLRGVIFDMDDTLTVPNLDFAEMYRRCGVDRSQDILRQVAESMKDSEAQTARQIIDEMEEESRRTLQLKPGALELQDWLTRHEIPTAIVTRNSAKTVQRLQQLGFTASGSSSSSSSSSMICISRDDPFPPKPDPAALFHICNEWNIEPGPSVLMVGDSPYDIQFGKAGGISTLLLGNTANDVDDDNENGNDDSSSTTRLTPDLTSETLLQIPQLLFQSFKIDSAVIRNYQPKTTPPQPTTAAGRAAVQGNLEQLLALQQRQQQQTNNAAPMNNDDSVLYQPDDTGNTPLIWAADAGHLHIVEALLQQLLQQAQPQQPPSVHVPATADHVNHAGYLGATALNRAARRGHDDIVRVLMEQGKASAEIPNERMQYPLHFAAFKQHPTTVQTLLECGANRWSFDRKGRTPADDTSDAAIREMILNKFKK